MSVRFQIAAMVYLMVQAVLFGAGILIILLTPLNDRAPVAMPIMIALSVVAAVALSWIIAPRLQMRYWRRRGTDHDFISG